MFISPLALVPLRIYVGCVTFAGIGGLFLGLWAHFIPSPEWSNQVWLIALVVGLLNAAAFLRISAVHRPTWKGEPASALRLWLAALALVWMGYIAVVAGIPIAAHLHHGGPASISATVLSLQGSPSQTCPSPIRLKGLLFPFNRYCTPSPEFTKTLSQGDQLILSGQGTEIGLFAKSASRAP